ncbi:BhlA/UviB family holin-like peptide [Brevibacillus fulvus]|uniref:Type IV restriction endonuclease n=1 Tax=Brevibacillus fulvus TaxID=1125967 RepID=A0A938Y3B7_9BACL|nr:BhlA/UviB family holin-like peptide [Brevibacillus fulvus]MBM7590847.1 putative type IV restriction endonuclease [Brevibacillus fulvus]
MDVGGLPIEMIVSQGIFAVLFVWLFIDTRRESKDRESRLLEQIDKQNQAQDRIVQAIERLEKQVSALTKT